MRDGGEGRGGYDVFIAHASADKEGIARPLRDALVAKNLVVWFDEHTMDAGAALGRSIDDGVARSRYGIAIVSPAATRQG